MNHREFIIVESQKYFVLDVKEHKYTVPIAGSLQRHIDGERGFKWLIEYRKYYVTVIDEKRRYTRTLVYTQRGAKDEIFIYFEKIAPLIWGGIPLDIEWAKNTLVYKNYIDNP